MIKLQQGLKSFLLAMVLCSTSYATASVSPSAPTTTTDEIQTTETKDPYEGFNRAMFNFNEAVDKYFMKPIATAYNTIMPKPLNQGVHNFFNNLSTIPTLANDVLQLNFYQAANDSWRLIINSTVGVGGLFDVASRIGLKFYDNDFGLTLATYGYENSNYLVLPFLGPSTPRDGIGIPVDYFVFSVYPRINPQSTRYQLFALWIVDRRAQILNFQDVIDEASVDKYVFVRNAYMQRRAFKINENQHLSYNERESAQEPVADLTEAEAQASLGAGAEPIVPLDQPIETETTAAVAPTSKQAAKQNTKQIVQATSKITAQKGTSAG